MNTDARREAKKRAAMMFSLVAALGVALVQYRAGATILIDPAVLITYVSVIAGAAFFGATFSGWYFKETGIFELLTTGIFVIICAAVFAGQCLALFLILFDLPEHISMIEALGFGFFASLFFLGVASPIVVPGATVASYILWRRYSSL